MVLLRPFSELMDGGRHASFLPHQYSEDTELLPQSRAAKCPVGYCMCTRIIALVLGALIGPRFVIIIVKLLAPQMSTRPSASVR